MGEQLRLIKEKISEHKNSSKQGIYKAITVAQHLYLYIQKVEQYRAKKETINKWMEPDRKKQEKFSILN